jgi:hypothetical protein
LGREIETASARGPDSSERGPIRASSSTTIDRPAALTSLAIAARLRHIPAMSGFERTDYSVVVKNRGNPPDPWRWEIYRAGRSSAIKQSSVYFHTMAMASRAGKEALKGLLEKLYA